MTGQKCNTVAMFPLEISTDHYKPLHTITSNSLDAPSVDRSCVQLWAPQQKDADLLE